jgi:hypothetical protein
VPTAAEKAGLFSSAVFKFFTIVVMDTIYDGHHV